MIFLRFIYLLRETQLCTKRVRWPLEGIKLSFVRYLRLREMGLCKLTSCPMCRGGPGQSWILEDGVWILAQLLTSCDAESPPTETRDLANISFKGTEVKGQSQCLFRERWPVGSRR